MDRIVIEDRIKIFLGVARKDLLLFSVVIDGFFPFLLRELSLALEAPVVQILERVVLQKV